MLKVWPEPLAEPDEDDDGFACLDEELPLPSELVVELDPDELLDELPLEDDFVEAGLGIKIKRKI